MMDLLMGIRPGGCFYVQDGRWNLGCCRVYRIQRHWTCIGLVAEQASEGAQIEETG